MSTTDKLLAIERSLWTEGADAYHRHLDDDCLIAFPGMAREMSREEVAGTVEGGPRWRDVEIEPVGLVRPVDDVALLTYRASARRGDDERYRALISSGYVRRDGEWKMVFHQQTPLDD